MEFLVTQQTHCAVSVSLSTHHNSPAAAAADKRVSMHHITHT